MSNTRKGFTLLEMTIVIIIISVIFLLSVPNVQKTLSVVNRKGCQAIEKTADAAILQYKLEYDEYPSSVNDLVNAGLLSEQQLTCDGSKQLTIVNGQAHIE
ncbi:MAG: competence type IV pilus major pilin ComGC [Bulleidia sp.]